MYQITMNINEFDYDSARTRKRLGSNSQVDNKIIEAYEKEANKIEIGDWVAWNTERKEGQIIRVFMERDGMFFPKDEESGYLKSDCKKLSPELQSLLNLEVK